MSVLRFKHLQIFSEDSVLRLNRRETLGTGFLLFLGNALPGRAQTVDDYARMMPAFELALQTRSFAIEANAEDYDNLLLAFLERDIAARTQTLDIANEFGFFAGFESTARYIESIPKFFQAAPSLGFDETYLESMRVVASGIASDGLPIAPPGGEAGAGTILASGPPEDSNLKVVVDILLETIGISGGDISLIVSAIESDQRLKSAVDDLIGAISTKDWEEVVQTAELLFKVVVASKIWVVIRETGGQKLSWRLGLRAVPIVGWLYCGAAFAISVKINYSRFTFEQ